MSLYHGNQSKIVKIREHIENLKACFNINSRIVQVADKGQNSAKNIYAASIEANDGCIFSKSIHGTGLYKQEKEWIRLENERMFGLMLMTLIILLKNVKNETIKFSVKEKMLLLTLVYLKNKKLKFKKIEIFLLSKNL